MKNYYREGQNDHIEIQKSVKKRDTVNLHHSRIDMIHGVFIYDNRTDIRYCV